MLKIFRKIRQKLLSENKFTNYLFYAIGEIVLVVIGILLALQVNTLNQNRLDAKEEKQLLQAIHTKMDHNKFQVNTGSKRYSDVINSSKELINLSSQETTTTSKEEVHYLIHNLSKRFLVGNSNKTSIYDEMIGAGKLNLLKSVQLRNELTSLKANMELLASYEDIQSSFVDNYLSPYLNKHSGRLEITVNGYSTDTSLYDKIFAESFSDVNVSNNSFAHSSLLEDPVFINLITELIYHTTALLPIYERVDKNISTIESFLSKDDQ